MTEQVGNQSEANKTSPWERVWNDASEKIVPVVKDVVQKALKAPTMPWNMDWGGSSSSPPSAPSRAIPAPSGSMETEGKMVAAAQFSPEEIKARDIQMRSPENLAEMRDAISKAKTPEEKKVLTEELNKLMRKK